MWYNTDLAESELKDYTYSDFISRIHENSMNFHNVCKRAELPLHDFFRNNNGICITLSSLFIIFMLHASNKMLDFKDIPAQDKLYQIFHKDYIFS